MKTVIIILLILISFVLGYFIAKFTNNMNSYIIELDEPLKIKSNKGNGVLPRGTILFHVKAMSEGFDTYKIYVNKEGRPFKIKKSEIKWYIAPVWIDKIE
jgi:regulatory protein YycH of two-component signal transduction system YycFG